MCDSSSLVRVMSLTPTPPGNALLKREELSVSRPSYPLDLYFCEDCHHIQLGHVVDPQILYQNHYLYVSATSAQFVGHLRDYAADMVKRFDLPPGALVADIGSNDGTCLRFFKEKGMCVVGVDPAIEIAREATSNGIETIAAFFSLSLAIELRKKYGPAAFITSHNACAHIDRLEDVMRGVAHWLTEDGIFVLEVGYFVDVYNNSFFDTIYHEHLDYHTVAPFRQLCERTGLELLSAQRIAPQGGSIRVLTQKAGGRLRRDSSIDDLINLENNLGLDRSDSLIRFGDRIGKLGKELRTLLLKIRSEGRSIAAYGAPTKAVTLLSHFGIGADLIDFVVEDNRLKHGMYLPISGIPVVPTAELYTRRPDYVLILAWNFAKPIMAMHERYAAGGGKFIVPMPEPRIV